MTSSTKRIGWVELIPAVGMANPYIPDWKQERKKKTINGGVRKCTYVKLQHGNSKKCNKFNLYATTLSKVNKKYMTSNENTQNLSFQDEAIN